MSAITPFLKIENLKKRRDDADSLPTKRRGPIFVSEDGTSPMLDDMLEYLLADDCLLTVGTNRYYCHLYACKLLELSDIGLGICWKLVV